MSMQPGMMSYRKGIQIRSSVAIMIFICLVSLCGCDYARMKEDEALRTYETLIPEMPKRAIPVEGGIQVLRGTDPDKLKNPLPLEQVIVERGKERYGFYCVQCHGTRADGYGTVGQSFVPMPADLKSAKVQEQNDGRLFHKISLGFGKHPPLFYTMTADEVWAVIQYMRSLAGQQKG